MKTDVHEVQNLLAACGPDFFSGGPKRPNTARGGYRVSSAQSSVSVRSVGLLSLRRYIVRVEKGDQVAANDSNGSWEGVCFYHMSFLFYQPKTLGAIKLTILGGMKQYKSMAILRDFPYNKALFGLVSYNVLWSKVAILILGMVIPPLIGILIMGI